MKRNFSILTVAVVLAASCSKSKDDARPAMPQPTIVGFWKGSYDGAGSSAYAFLFRTNGTVRVYANNTDTAAAKKGEGTYTLTPDKTGVDGSYTYPSTGTHYSFSGTLLNATTVIKGQYTQLDGNAKGSFTVSRQ